MCSACVAACSRGASAASPIHRSRSSKRKNRTGGLTNDVLRCRTKEHEIGCSSASHPHHDQFGLTSRGDPQDLPPWLAAEEHRLGLAVGRRSFWHCLFEE